MTQLPASDIKALTLREVVTTEALHRAWKSAVRPGLRNQQLSDLHDYLDVHRQRSERFDRLRDEVLSGRYRPREPSFAFAEKKLGIQRRFTVPDPEDAVLLQCITDSLQDRVLKAAPSAKSFYSRSHSPPPIADFDADLIYPWWRQWPAFQQQVFRFATSHPYLAVTDIATFFDTVPLGRLRDTVAALTDASKEILDLLFYLLEAFQWRPHYMPPSGVGLPTINFDAPRLLSHAFLFEADSLLVARARGDFVRWMDDINFGANSVEDAKATLSELDALLNTQGVRLNSGKSLVLSSAEAADHFWIPENTRLNFIQKRLALSTSPRARALLPQVLRSGWKRFNRAEKKGQHGKITKRYLNLFGQLQSDALQSLAAGWLRDSPDLRPFVLKYFVRLGYSRARFKILRDYVLSGHCLDDVSRLAVAETLCAWRIPPRSRTRAELLGMADAVALVAGAGFSHFGFGLWLKAKYGTRKELGQYLDDTTDTWSRSSWAARQAAATYGRLRPRDRRRLSDRLLTAGLPAAFLVLEHLRDIEALAVIDSSLRAYLQYPPHGHYNYPLPKALVLEAVLRGTGLDSTAKDALVAPVLAMIDDLVLARTLKRACLD